MLYSVYTYKTGNKVSGNEAIMIVIVLAALLDIVVLTYVIVPLKQIFRLSAGTHFYKGIIVVMEL